MTTQTTTADRVRPLGDDDIGAAVTGDGVAPVEFSSGWCGACQRMAPVLETIAADTDAAVLTVDVESHLGTAVEFGARSTPTFVLFVGGQPAERLRGPRPEQSLRELISRHDD